MRNKLIPFCAAALILLSGTQASAAQRTVRKEYSTEVKGEDVNRQVNCTVEEQDLWMPDTFQLRLVICNAEGEILSEFTQPLKLNIDGIGTEFNLPDIPLPEQGVYARLSFMDSADAVLTREIIFRW